MQTVANINVIGLDPQAWEQFRALLTRHKLSVSLWGRGMILDCLTRDNPFPVAQTPQA